MTAAALAAGFILAAGASAATITFDRLTGSDDTEILTGIYQEAGYTLTAEDGGILYSWGSAEYDSGVAASDQYGGYTGSAAIFNDSYTQTTLTATNGSLFNLTSVDLCELYAADPYDATLTIIGTKADGNTITEAITLDGTFGYQTFSLGTDFTNLSYVTFYTENYGDFQIDNINVSGSSAVPVPGAFMLLGSGLLAASCVTRRKN